MSAPRPIPADEARARLACAGVAPPSVETVPLALAQGRVLARPLVAPEAIPSAAKAVMDGYAVRAVDVAAASTANPVTLAVIGAVRVGRDSQLNVAPGQAVEIPTGGLLPAGADAVVMVEHTQRHGDRVAIKAPVAAGKNVIGPGGDMAAGLVVIEAGTRLGAASLAALAAFGQVNVAVFARPRIAILSTGTELCPPDEAPEAGQVRDVNQSLLAALAHSAGADVTMAGIVADDPALLEATLQRLCAEHVMVLVSGGSSVGGRDHTAEVVARLPASQVLFHGIDVRPGKPTLAAQVGLTLLFGLPGFPTSSGVIFEAFVRPLVARATGESPASATTIDVVARLATPITSAPGREDWLRVRLYEREGEPWAEPLPGGAAVLSSLLGADGLLVIPAGVDSLAAGTPVRVHLLD